MPEDPEVAPSTVDGRPTAPDPATGSGDAVPGTMQMPAGAMVPAMATIRGDAAIEAPAPPAMPAVRYELGAEIARGGMGRVVEATDTTLGRVVALKEALSLDADTLRRFARETRITARLEHPAIVPVHDAGIGPNGAPYYVMRKIGGKPLEKFVATGETLESRLALVPHMVAAANAIAHAHARGIVHRDIKPSNILVGDLGEVIVIDWGLAKVVGEVEDDIGGPVLVDLDDSLKTRAGVVYGTPGFMAPEQLRGRPVDARCDVYALGATLYHLLSRKPPHHAETADAMMKAAVNAPPTPIGELVSGIPPELSTIIDKALAHDPDQRYQDARALAEDLNRFLTGQLVASHHYTPRERITRFVKKNKVTVIAIGLAALVLIVGGWVSYLKVASERDRADASAAEARRDKETAELQKALAETRNEKLTLSQAWIVSDTNPTLAVAMVKPLAEKHWREVRSIAAAARAGGVAWSLPASPTMASLEIGRDGTLALGAGDDGVVRLYDLPKREARTIAEMGTKVHARFADQDRKIVVWSGTTLTVIDRVGSGRREMTVTTPIHDLELVGITAYWTDTAGGFWQLDLAGTQPIQIPEDQKIIEIAPSPDGHWIALWAEDDLLLLDRTRPTEPPATIAVGRTKGLDWAADSSHLGALVEEYAIDLQMAPVPIIVRKLTVGERFFVTYGDEQLFTIGPTGVAIVSRDLTKPRRQLVGFPVGLGEARDHTIVAASEEGMAVLSPHGDHYISIPTGRLTRLAVGSSSPYILGAIDERLLVWNLDEIQPRAIAEHPATATFVGSDAVIATYVDAPAQWIDLVTGTVRTLGAWPAITSSASAPGGQLAAIVDLAHHAKLVSATAEPKDLAGTVDMIGFPSAHQVLLGAYTGALVLHDATTGTSTTLVDRPDELIGMAWNRTEPAWVCAIYKDLTLWRTQLGGESQTARLPSKPNSSLYIGPDGAVLFASGATLLAWRPDGSIVQHAVLPKPIIELGTTGTEKLVAFTEAGAAYLVDLAQPGTVIDIDRSLGRTKAAMAAETGTIVVESRGELAVIEPLVDHKRWMLANPPGLPLTSPQISADGRRILAQSPQNLLVWTLALPAGPEETAAWLDRLSNATTGTGSKSLGWR